MQGLFVFFLFFFPFNHTLPPPSPPVNLRQRASTLVMPPPDPSCPDRGLPSQKFRAHPGEGEGEGEGTSVDLATTPSVATLPQGSEQGL